MRPVRVLTNDPESKTLVRRVLNPKPDKSVAYGLALAYLRAQGMSDQEAREYIGV